MYPYTAANIDELSLAIGDMVTIISRDVPDQGWWKGELKGKIGLFPDNFVTVLPIVCKYMFYLFFFTVMTFKLIYLISE